MLEPDYERPRLTQRIILEPEDASGPMLAEAFEALAKAVTDRFVHADGLGDGPVALSLHVTPLKETEE